MKVTEELAYLLGTFKYGAVYKNKKEGIYRIRLYQKYKEWLITVQKVFENVFNKKLYLRKDPRKELWYLEINDKKLFSILGGMLSKPIPVIVKNAPLKIQKNLKATMN